MNMKLVPTSRPCIQLVNQESDSSYLSKQHTQTTNDLALTPRRNQSKARSVYPQALGPSEDEAPVEDV